MKFRIQNINTGNYFSQPVPHEVAVKFLSELNAFQRECGYRIPDYVFERIKREIGEENE